MIEHEKEQGGAAVCLNVGRTFDPDYAHRCGVDLHRLMMVRTYNVQQAIALLPDFATSGGTDLLVFDTPLHPPLEPERQQRLSAGRAGPKSGRLCAAMRPMSSRYDGRGLQ